METMKFRGYRLCITTFVNGKPCYKHSNYYDTIEELFAAMARNPRVVLGKNIKIIYIP